MVLPSALLGLTGLAMMTAGLVSTMAGTVHGIALPRRRLLRRIARIALFRQDRPG